MSGTDHERWNEDLAAYVLGALGPAEVAALERHLEDCERCQGELRWLQPAAAALPETVERVEPPPRLRARLIAEVEAGAGGSERASMRGLRRRLAARLRGSGPGPLALRPAIGLAALVLVAAAMLGYALSGDSGEGGGTSTIAAGQPPGVTATMVDEGDGGTLRLANVRQLPDGKVLEAWVLRDGEVEAVRALFVPDREGRASTQLPPMDGVEEVMVTAEPKGGSETPTGEPLIAIPVPG
jgi:anti-sigma-K factor RskA